MANPFMTLAICEGDVVGVSAEGISVTSSLMGLDIPTIVPGILGGVSDSGVYQGQAGAGVQKGDKVLLCRVHPGSMGTTQILRVIPGPNRHLNSKQVRISKNMPAGRTCYPTNTMDDGDIRITGEGGGELSLRGKPLNSQVFLGNNLKSGIYINSAGKMTSIASVSHTAQSVSSGHRMFSGTISRAPGGAEGEGSAVSTGHDIGFVFTKEIGRPRGFWPGIDALDTSFLDRIRNPAISQYRLVINEVSEHARYKGWDLESDLANKSSPEKFSSSREKSALDPSNVLHLQPHQLIEIIGGNVANRQGELLDPNYGVVKIGDASGLAMGTSKAVYEEARIISRRGIGYHFQMSTNSLSTQYSNDIDNFVLALDKEGVLKLSVPKSSKAGNVLYPTNANFYNDGADSVVTVPDDQSIKSEEKIPVLLRTKDNEVILPSSEILSSGGQITSIDNTRNTGVRYTNEDNYFQGVKAVVGGGKSVRINPTKFHNMYAAAEMLIANKVSGVMVPVETSECPGIEKGNKCGEPFERYTTGGDGSGTDPDAEPKFMTVVQVYPGEPAIDPGGGVIVAGTDRSIGVTRGDDSVRINVPYTNSFGVSEGVGGFVSTNKDKSGDSRRDPGGKSANLNFEGSIEASIGKDHNDAKSILLDTAGSMVAWFGKDKRGRSMILQTDGDVLFNVGGVNGNEFNKGRFDLRVNVTNKGWFGDEDFTPPGGPHASDYIISISENGLVIAGMKPDTPMIIRNDGDLSIESTAKLILAAASIEMREGNRPPRKTHQNPVSQDQEEPTLESVAEDIECIIKELSDLTS